MPEILKTRPIQVDVERESELTRRETVCNFYGILDKLSNAGKGAFGPEVFEILHLVLRNL